MALKKAVTPTGSIGCRLYRLDAATTTHATEDEQHESDDGQDDENRPQHERSVRFLSRVLAVGSGQPPFL